MLSPSNYTTTKYSYSVNIGTSPSKPDIQPHTPDGWASSLVVNTSSSSAGNTYTTFKDTDTIYVYRAYKNSGSSITATFYVYLYVDGKHVKSWSVDGLESGKGKYNSSGYSIGSLSAGTHTIKIVLDATGVVSESKENNNTIERTITVTAPSKPDLQLYTPDDWASSLVVNTSSSSAGNTYTTFKDTDTIYVYRGYKNSGSSITATFYVYLYVDGTHVKSWSVDGIESGKGKYSSSGYSIGSLSAGTHTIKIVLDATGVVPESNENNNTITRTITVSSSGKPDLSPYTPKGWSGPLVVSSSSANATNRTNMTFWNTDVLYVSWACQCKNADVSVPFNMSLYVDNVQKKSWDRTVGISAGKYVTHIAESIGYLSAGTHTLRFVVDSGSSVSESDETNNSTTMTITVSEDPSSNWPVTITFLPGGGSGSMPSVTKYVNLNDSASMTYVLPECEFFYSGHTFAGWQVEDAGRVYFSSLPVYPAGYVYDQISADLTLTATWSENYHVGLPTALDDTSLSFTTDGASSWFGQVAKTHDGTDAARSGELDDGQTSWLQTTVTGQGTISFWWYVSSEENFDFLEFLIDGVVMDSISGQDNSWAKKSYTITSDGTHTLQWRYRKDVSNGYGLDAGFVDQVTWEADSTPTSYSITLFKNDGTVTYRIYDAVGWWTIPSISSLSWSRPGYDFLGWSRSDTATSATYSDGQTVAFSSDMALYGVWRARSDVTLPVALDNTSLSFTTGGDLSWYGQAAKTHDGTDAARSGELGDGQTSWLQTTVTGQGTISFWWYVSSEEDFDFLEFLIDGNVKASISGDGNTWASKSYSITSAGSHTLQWRYRKDSSAFDGLDAGFVDQVSWVPVPPYTVIFDANGGTGGTTRSVARNTSVGALPTPSRSEYSFLGWFTASDGGTKIAETTKVTTDVTYYAHWLYVGAADDSTIVFNTEETYETESDGSLPLDLSELVGSTSTPKITVKGLPAGLKFDANTRTISGKVTKPGVYTVTLSATNATVKKPVTATFEIVVPNLTSEKLPNLEPERNAYGTIRCGVAFNPEWVDCTPEKGWAVKVAGLPAGLKYDAKTGKIIGVPTKAGTFTVTFTASKKGEANQVATITLETAALPEWAQGTFTGYVKCRIENGELEEGYGLATMTVAANGKVSGKIALDGTNWTFSATSYAVVECPTSDVNDASFIVAATAKAGKLTMPVSLAVRRVEDGRAGHAPLPDAVAEGTFGDGEAQMWRNVWKDKATAAAAKEEIARWEGVYTLSMEDGGYMSLTVGKKGDVKASGKLSDGTSVSATSPLMYDVDEGWFVLLYAAPSAYKGGSFAAVVGFDASVPGATALTPVMFTPVWTSKNPQATGAYGGGFARSLSFTGAYYNKAKLLSDYYGALKLSLDTVPELAYTYKYSFIGWSGKKETESSLMDATAIDTLWQEGLTATVDGKGKIVVVKATKPVQDKETKEWFYYGANDGAMALSFTQATGIFKGSYTFWYDYESAYDDTTWKTTRAHVSKKVSFEGILVQGEESMKGFYLWDATGTYADPKTGKAKTYKYKESKSVSLAP